MIDVWYMTLKAQNFSQKQTNSSDNMMNLNKRTFLSLVFAMMFLSTCNGQMKKTLPKENVSVSAGQPKLTHRSTNIGDNVHAILQDKTGNLWFATTGDGVYRYDGKSFTSFKANVGLDSNTIFSILEDKKGNIWFGTCTGIFCFDGNNFRHIPMSEADTNYSLPFTPTNNDPSTSFLVFSILEDRRGRLWFGTDKGVYCYNGKAFEVFLDNQSVVNSNALNLNTVNRMIEDKYGNIWFTTKTEGVCRYDGKSIVNYKPNDEAYFWGLLEDTIGNIWVGGRNKGVWRYDGKTFTNVLQNGRFDSYIAFSIIQDKTGNIWFGTEAVDPSNREDEGGVWRYDGKTFKNFSTKDGLSHYGVWSLLEDKAGNIWVGTRNTGLCRFDGKTFTGFSE
jgi:ligand-binding sensor domain-containing protein